MSRVSYGNAISVLNLARRLLNQLTRLTWVAELRRQERYGWEACHLNSVHQYPFPVGWTGNSKLNLPNYFRGALKTFKINNTYTYFRFQLLVLFLSWEYFLLFSTNDPLNHFFLELLACFHRSRYQNHIRRRFLKQDSIYNSLCIKGAFHYFLLNLAIQWTLSVPSLHMCLSVNFDDTKLGMMVENTMVRQEG